MGLFTFSCFGDWESPVLVSEEEDEVLLRVAKRPLCVADIRSRSFGGNTALPGEGNSSILEWRVGREAILAERTPPLWASAGETEATGTTGAMLAEWCGVAARTPPSRRAAPISYPQAAAEQEDAALPRVHTHNRP